MIEISPAQLWVLSEMCNYPSQSVRIGGMYENIYSYILQHLHRHKGGSLYRYMRYAKMFHKVEEHLSVVSTATMLPDNDELCCLNIARFLDHAEDIIAVSRKCKQRKFGWYDLICDTVRWAVEKELWRNACINRIAVQLHIRVQDSVEETISGMLLSGRARMKAYRSVEAVSAHYYDYAVAALETKERLEALAAML